MLEGFKVSFLTWIPCSLEGGNTNFSPFSWDKLFVQNVTSTLSLSPFSFWKWTERCYNTIGWSILCKFRLKYILILGLLISAKAILKEFSINVIIQEINTKLEEKNSTFKTSDKIFEHIRSDTALHWVPFLADWPWQTPRLWTESRAADFLCWTPGGRHSAASPLTRTPGWAPPEHMCW